MNESEVLATVRKACGCSGRSFPIIRAEDPVQSPKLQGESFYWTTASGRTRIKHPNSYRWPKTYHPSTLKIVVGQLWIKACYEFKRGVPPEMITDRAKEMAGLEAEYAVPE